MKLFEILKTDIADGRDDDATNRRKRLKAKRQRVDPTRSLPTPIDQQAEIRKHHDIVYNDLKKKGLL